MASTMDSHLSETSQETVRSPSTENPLATPDGLSTLRSVKSTRRLEQIAELRARGIGEHIDLPQLVVCGDQSAGKSSVLEGLTGIPFPRNDGLCTKFATEIILQQSTCELTIVATVLPASSRTDSEKAVMNRYKRQLESLAFDELPVIIAEAGKLMGVRGFDCTNTGPAFAEDVLRIEVTGPVGLHLSVVDLPGLISVPNEDQTEDDVKTVHRLVDEYLENGRSIILAVVQAGNDIANQPIIQKSRKYDKSGKRTVGIITKPDLVNKGTESRIALLAKNQDSTKLKLGYFLVKNPTPTELQEGITFSERVKSESRYFKSPPWKEFGLNPDRVGILSLRSYLQALLDEHIENELPKVRADISKLMDKTTEEIDSLGFERATDSECRLYLSRLAMQFYNLATSASNGTYHEADATFFSTFAEGESNRLRASVHRYNTEFSNFMQMHGEKRKIREGSQEDESEETGEEESEKTGEEESENEVRDRSSHPGRLTRAMFLNAQLAITSAEMDAWVHEVYARSRGKELPGNYNHVLLSELFHVQSSRWEQIARDHVDSIAALVEQFVNDALGHLIKDEGVRLEIEEMTRSNLQSSKILADAELRKLIEDESRQPITYNHYFTDNIQNARQKGARDSVKEAFDSTERVFTNKGSGYLAYDDVIRVLERQRTVDMDHQACHEALEGLKAYYKVARKSFVDNVCKQVIERHLVCDLPAIFSPEDVARMDDEKLVHIAGEKPGNVRKRKELRELYEQLGESLRSLHK